MISTGLSQSSVLKYYGAIEGVLSDWARDAALIEGNILEIKKKSHFESLVKSLHTLQAFQVRNNTGHNMYSSALNKYSEYLSSFVSNSIEEDIQDILYEESINQTEKIQLISARIGQGLFRKSLFDYWGKCAVTGVTEPTMLLASHIKPWSMSTNTERLDRFNGLLLIPNLDSAFDKGHITFDDTGLIIISSDFTESVALGINKTMSVNLNNQHQSYMEFHRKNIFMGNL